MITNQLQHVLESTGYLLPSQRCASGVRIGADAQKQRRGREFRPDALWEGQSSLRVYFKYVRDDVPNETIGTWRREIWNEGTSPLLWTVTPQRILIYNAFGRPQPRDDAEANRLETFENVASGLERLDSFAGHLAMETGQFWRNEPRVNRKTGVDHQLLSDLGALERDLVDVGLPRIEAQDLIGRCIFTQYLIDRRIVDPDLLQEVCGQRSLPLALGDPAAAERLFAWLRQTFSGDVFPMRSAEELRASRHLERAARIRSDRRIVDPDLLQEVCGQRSLPLALGDPAAAERLFAWLRQTFSGDVFPMRSAEELRASHHLERAVQILIDRLRHTFRGDVFPMRSAEELRASRHLERVVQFLRGSDPSSGRQSIFPYQFDVIPVEFIGSIYEQIAHAGGEVNATGTHRTGKCYTRPSPVSLVVDEVMREAHGSESVLDIACGSGVFLVNTLRRLVCLRSKGAEPTREIIRSTLYEQVVGIDSDETAVRVAAFSLYLAALDLDPNPTPPDALRFKPLIGTSLFVGDAKRIAAGDKSPQGMTGSDGRARKFDVIVGTSPMDFKAKTGTEARQARETSVRTPPPFSESLDFVDDAREFAHEKTRFGLILSALPFFSGSGSGQNASQRLLQSLAPATLVNLSNLRSWLFPNSKMAAVALFARQFPKQCSDQLTVVQVPWSESGKRTHTFEIAPSDILKVPLSSLQARPELLKAAAFGRQHDLMLLDRLKNRHETLKDQLGRLGSKLSLGLIFGNRSSVRDTKMLQGLPMLGKASIRHFAVEPDLPTFETQPAEIPRTRETYRAPLLLVKKSLTLAAGPRLVVSVTDRDTVFAQDFLGTSLPPTQTASAHLLAAILNSALGSWYSLITSSTLGLWINRLIVADLNRFPVPDLHSAVESANGRRALGIASSLQQRIPTESDWNELDEAVFDLYELDETERIVVRDGLGRTGWLWHRGQRDSVAPARVADLKSYARAFLETMDAWFSARRVRRMRAEIFKLPSSASLRVIRFVLEERPGPSILEAVPVEGRLATVLKQIGDRLDVQIAKSLVGTRELRVHGPNEVVIIKPSARRHWMGVCALEDANAVVAKSVSGVVT